MQNIHFVDKNIGGVGVICSRLSESGDVVHSLSISRIIKEIKKTDSCERIYFHQPRSHLYCMIISFMYPAKKKRFSCILHEAADYNKGVTNIFRSTIGFIARTLVISILNRINVNILGVSNYVLGSYGILNGQRISYLHLFKEYAGLTSKEGMSSDNLLYKSTLTAWIRKGDAHRVIKVINSMESIGLIANVNLFGDNSEVLLLKKQIKKTRNYIKINPHPSRLRREDFISELEKSTWFISMFDKEGFGLSVFDAMAAGCICLTSKSGAIIEWLPSENFLVLDKIMSNNQITTDCIHAISRLNKTTAVKLISENQ